MWSALGQCYENEQLGCSSAALRCFRRALETGDREGIALHKLVRGSGAPGGRGGELGVELQGRAIGWRQGIGRALLCISW